MVILGTLVLQGLSLPWLVRRLKLIDAGPSSAQQEMDARLALLAAANLFLDERSALGVSAEEIEFFEIIFEPMRIVG